MIAGDAAPGAAVERLRLFAAASIPHDLQSEVARATAPLRASLPQARWVVPENLHVTLKFLGYAAGDALEAIATACGIVARGLDPATLHLEGLGAFPSARRARVLWVGIADPAGLLAQAARDLDQALEPLGFPAEDRPFTPHLTVARFKAPAAVPAGLEIGSIGEPFEVRSLDLYRSKLSPQGARYHQLRSSPLGRPS